MWVYENDKLSTLLAGPIDGKLQFPHYKIKLEPCLPDDLATPLFLYLNEKKYIILTALLFARTKRWN